jgi:hypothetical protein
VPLRSVPEGALSPRGQCKAVVPLRVACSASVASYCEREPVFPLVGTLLGKVMCSNPTERSLRPFSLGRAASKPPLNGGVFFVLVHSLRNASRPSWAAHPRRGGLYARAGRTRRDSAPERPDAAASQARAPRRPFRPRQGADMTGRLSLCLAVVLRCQIRQSVTFP